MKHKIVFILSLLASSFTLNAQSTNHSIFDEGSLVKNENFQGNVKLNMLLQADSVYNNSIGVVRFEPNAKTNWHYHPGGQILLIIDGEGWYQERGKEIKAIKKGEIITCPSNVEHWHGATDSQHMSHIAIGTNTDKGNVVWLEKVE